MTNRDDVFERLYRATPEDLRTENLVLRGNLDALVAACEALLSEIGLILSLDGFSMPSERQAEVLAGAINQARAALARARGAPVAEWRVE